nr:MAG TPA: hypothetical protein [Caudoviricetes sp.]
MEEKSHYSRIYISTLLIEDTKKALGWGPRARRLG